MAHLVGSMSFDHGLNVLHQIRFSRWIVMVHVERDETELLTRETSSHEETCTSMSLEYECMAFTIH